MGSSTATDWMQEGRAILRPRKRKGRASPRRSMLGTCSRLLTHWACVEVRPFLSKSHTPSVPAAVSLLLLLSHCCLAAVSLLPHCCLAAVSTAVAAVSLLFHGYHCCLAAVSMWVGACLSVGMNQNLHVSPSTTLMGGEACTVLSMIHCSHGWGVGFAPLPFDCFPGAWKYCPLICTIK